MIELWAPRSTYKEGKWENKKGQFDDPENQRLTSLHDELDPLI